MLTVGVLVVGAPLPGRGVGEEVTVPAEVCAFHAECGSLAEESLASERGAVAGKEGWIFLANELRHMSVGRFWGPASATASRATRDDAKDPLPVILDFAQQLSDLGIGLLIVPVPPKAVAYADKLTDGALMDAEGHPQRTDPYHGAFYSLLRERGISVLDLTEAFLEARKQDATLGPVYCRHDTHWAPRACRLAATKIREAIGGPDWLKSRQRGEYHASPESIVITGDLWTMLGDADLTKETVTVTRVGPERGSTALVETDPTSPILLLADSHGLVFHVGGDMHARGAGLADHLMLEFGLPIDTICRRGSAATSIRIDLARKFYRDQAYLESKKSVIWCFAAREFTETMGWRRLRISKQR